MCPEVSVLDMQERRQHPRFAADTAARLLVNYKLVVCCIVRDVSIGGACLELPEVANVPDHFDLITDGAGYVCHVVWRRDRRMGVAFQ
jgi:hypothetical protein